MLWIFYKLFRMFDIWSIGYELCDTGIKMITKKWRIDWKYSGTFRRQTNDYHFFDD